MENVVIYVLIQNYNQMNPMPIYLRFRLRFCYLK